MKFIKTKENSWFAVGYNGTKYGIEYDVANACYWTTPFDLEFNSLESAVSYWNEYDSVCAMAYKLMNDGIKCADCFGTIRHLWLDWDEITYIYCESGALAKQFAQFTACMMDIYKSDSYLRESEFGSFGAVFHNDGHHIKALDDGLAEFITNLLK